MTKEQFDSLYYGKAVHCDTEEKANHFLALADSVGHKWFSGSSLIEENLWEYHKEKTCYEVTNSGLFYARFEFFKNDNYKFVEYTLPPKFKVGNKVRVNNASSTANGKVGVIERVHTSSPMLYTVNIDGDDIHEFWYLYETQIEKVEEPTYKEETIDDIIKEIKDNQKRTTILLNRLETKLAICLSCLIAWEQSWQYAYMLNQAPTLNKIKRKGTL